MNKRIGIFILAVVLLISCLSLTASAAVLSSGTGTWLSGQLSYEYEVISDGASAQGAAGSVTVNGGTMTVAATSSKATRVGSRIKPLQSPLR